MILLLFFVIVTVGIPIAVEAVKRPGDSVLLRSGQEIRQLEPVREFTEWGQQLVFEYASQAVKSLPTKSILDLIWALIRMALEHVGKFITSLWR